MFLWRRVFVSSQIELGVGGDVGSQIVWCSAITLTLEDIYLYSCHLHKHQTTNQHTNTEEEKEDEDVEDTYIHNQTTTKQQTQQTQHVQLVEWQLPLLGQRGRKRHATHLRTFQQNSTDTLRTDSPPATSTATLSTIATHRQQQERPWKQRGKRNSTHKVKQTKGPGGLPRQATRQKARREEMDFMLQFGVTTPSSFEECLEQTGYDPIPIQSLDLDKGDQGSPQVAMDTPFRSSIDPQRLERALCWDSTI